jgi:hypothetical protein
MIESGKTGEGEEVLEWLLGSGFGFACPGNDYYAFDFPSVYPVRNTKCI